MGDAENALAPTKKRAAGREISRDNPGLDDDEDSAEQEMGTFKRASDEVLASRKIVKVRRNQTASTPSSNPFAGIRLVPPAEATAVPAVVKAEGVPTSGKVSPDEQDDACETDEKDKNVNSKQSDSKAEEPVAETAAEETEDKKLDYGLDEAIKPEADTKKLAEDNKTDKEKPTEGDSKESEDTKDSGSKDIDQSAEGASLSSFQQLSSSQNAFTGLAGTGLSSSTFSFGPVPKDGSTLGASSGSLFPLKNHQSSFGFGLSNNGSSSIFNTGSSATSMGKGSGFPPLQEVTVETGEENERVVFSADSVLFEFDGAWKERGKGELKVNVSTTGTERARIVMRTRGNYRLILNANLYTDMKLTNMDKRGITFACLNSASEGKEGLSTYAVKFKDPSIVEEFRAAISAHKDKTATVLKTPENSPKASEE